MTSASRKLLSESIPPGIDIHGSDGAMIKLAESLGLNALILRHNNPAERFHLDEHQTVCLGFQFENTCATCASAPRTSLII